MTFKKASLLNKENSVEDRQSRIAWQAVNEVSRRKSASGEKLNVACQEEILMKWKEHFKNLIRNPLEISYKPIQKIVNSQQDIKLGQLMEEELAGVLKKKMKTKKPKFGRQAEVWKTRKFDDILLWLCKDEQDMQSTSGESNINS